MCDINLMGVNVSIYRPRFFCEINSQRRVSTGCSHPDTVALKSPDSQADSSMDDINPGMSVATRRPRSVFLSSSVPKRPILSASASVHRSLPSLPVGQTASPVLRPHQLSSTPLPTVRSEPVYVRGEGVMLSYNAINAIDKLCHAFAGSASGVVKLFVAWPHFIKDRLNTHWFDRICPGVYFDAKSLFHLFITITTTWSVPNRLRMPGLVNLLRTFIGKMRACYCSRDRPLLTRWSMPCVHDRRSLPTSIESLERFACEYSSFGIASSRAATRDHLKLTHLLKLVQLSS